jgi:hypothetical protein
MKNSKTILTRSAAKRRAIDHVKAATATTSKGNAGANENVGI